MARFTAAEIMARSEITLSPTLDIYLALQQLLRRKLTGAPVVDEHGVILGMLTERDCLKVLVGGVFDGRPSGNVEDYMSTPAESISPAASLYDIVRAVSTSVRQPVSEFTVAPPRARSGRWPGRREAVAVCS